MKLRYIGSKTLLLENIEKIIKKHTTGRETTFCDIFSGTGVVARYFKPMYQVYTNDTLNFSYVIQKATIENNKQPMFGGLQLQGIKDPFIYLEETPIKNIVRNDDDFFIANNYAPHEHCKRMYLTANNAVRIDFIRTTIERWKLEGWIEEQEYYYLLAGLIEGVPYVSNITGTYGAYLKQWDKRSLKPFEMVRLDVYDNNKKNMCFNEDANQLIQHLDGEILYLDPPYNTRQYAPNYHLLETIAQYDKPQIQGVTGMRPYQHMKSAFCIRGQVLEAFEELIAKAKFDHLILSYNTDGLMSTEQIATIMKKYAIDGSFRLYSVPYRKYKGKLDQKTKSLYEHIFVIRKDKNHPITFDYLDTKKRFSTDARQSNRISRIPNPLATDEDEMEFWSNPLKGVSNVIRQEPVKAEYMHVKDIAKYENTKRARKKYIKSPFNYVGGKYKMLPQIMPLFPKDIRNFVDLFAGGCNVGINANAKSIVFNDINSKVIQVFECFKRMDLEDILQRIDQNIATYQLSKTNEEGFKQFRDYYNRTQHPIDLYTLTCYSFNYQFRFNNRLEYNNPFGKNRSQFADSMRTNLITFVKALHEKNVEFMTGDFSLVSLDRFGSEDFIYCDPPYIISTGTYNDGKRGFKDWKEQEEIKLYEYLDRANARGIRFAISNVIEHKGKRNESLYEWSKKYRIIELNGDYSNASYNTTRDKSREVLVVNYE